jgi:hypothetical protein
MINKYKNTKQNYRRGENVPAQRYSMVNIARAEPGDKRT